MANTFNPLGFDPGSRSDGASWSGNLNGNYQILYSNTHQIFKGDPVTVLSSGYIDTLAPGSISSTVMPCGIFWGCQYISASQQKLVFMPYFPGSDTITNGIVTAFVIDDPSVSFWVQTGYSTSPGGAATQAMVGMNATYAYGTGSTSTGLSGAYIDLHTTPAVTAALPFRIMALPSDPWTGAPGSNGLDNTTAFNLVLVNWNNQFQKQLTGV